MNDRFGGNLVTYFRLNSVEREKKGEERETEREREGGKVRELTRRRKEARECRKEKNESMPGVRKVRLLNATCCNLAQSSRAPSTRNAHVCRSVSEHACSEHWNPFSSRGINFSLQFSRIIFTPRRTYFFLRESYREII